MAGYLVRRVAQMVPLLIGITFLSFLIMNLAPGNFFSQLRMNPAISPELVRQLEREFGYGDPLLVQYGKWLWRVLHFDFGMSVAYRVDVIDLIGMRVGNTLILALSSLFVTWMLAIPLGILVALRVHSWLDRSLSFAAFVCMSLPSFFLAFLLMYLALQTGWAPVGGTISVGYDQLDWWGKIVDRARHLVLPTLVLGTAGIAGLMRLMRSAILDIKEADFVRTARAKGLPESAVISKHILRNALNPFITLAGAEMGELLGGAALVEAVMNLQGMGTLILEAVQRLDTYVVMGSILIGSLLLLVGNLLADLVLTVVDPRIDFTRLERGR